jgi:branched-chain amino acid transport system permease protein
MVSKSENQPQPAMSPTGRPNSWAKFDRLWLPATVLLFLVLPLVYDNQYFQHVLILVFMWALVGQAWSIAGGYAGMISFGHIVFFGLGAYISTVLFLHFGLSPWIGLPVGGLLSGGFAVLIGYPLSKLRGHYFAIATIALQQVVQILFSAWGFVGGANGLSLPLKSGWAHFQFSSKLPYYYIILVLYALSVLATYWMIKSKPGFYFRAIANDEDSAKRLGVDIARYKSLALGVSAFFTALAGTFYAQYVLYIDPASILNINLSTIIVLVATLGGAVYLFGPLVGALILIPISEYARAWLGGTGRGVDLMIYGILITVIVVYQPSGVMGWLQRLRTPGHRPVPAGLPTEAHGEKP